MTLGNRAWMVFLLATLISTAWLEGNIRGKETIRARQTDAQELVAKEADWLTQLQIAQVANASR